MPLIEWVASLSAAERDAIRTIALVVGSGCVPLFGLILTWMARLIRRQTGQTVQQTQAHDFVGGKLRSVPLGEMVRRAMLNTEETLRNTREVKDTSTKTLNTTQELRGEFRSEITDLVNDPRTGIPVPGVVHMRRHRLPTTDIPSLYTGDTDNE